MIRQEAGTLIGSKGEGYMLDHTTLRFGFRHPTIPMGTESEYLTRAFSS